MYTQAEGQMAEKRILEPCMEILESIKRRKDSRQDYTQYLRQEKQKLIQKIKNGHMIIPRITVVLSTKCTLKCAECFSLMQYYETPSDLAFTAVLDDLEQFFSLADYCLQVSVVGGEPFIYPDLDHILNYLCENEKAGSVEITTNGTVVPDKKILEIMQNEKIIVKISDYGRIDMMSKLVRALDSCHIQSECCVNEKWIDIGGTQARGRSKDELEKLYMSCGSGKMCKTLFKGKIYDCPRAAHLVDLGFAKHLEFIDLYACSKDDLFLFWIKSLSDACDYCDFVIEDKKYVEPAVQLNGRHFERSSHTLISRKVYEDIIDAKQFWEQQFYNSEKVIKELRDWNGELEAAKEYFLKRIEALEKQNAQRMEEKKAEHHTAGDKENDGLHERTR